MATGSTLPGLTERNRANLFLCPAPGSPRLLLWVSLRGPPTEARYAFLSPILIRESVPYGRFRQTGRTFTRCFLDGIRLAVSAAANGHQTENISCSLPKAKSGPSARQAVLFAR